MYDDLRGSMVAVLSISFLYSHFSYGLPESQKYANSIGRAAIISLLLNYNFIIFTRGVHFA